MSEKTPPEAPAISSEPLAPNTPSDDPRLSRRLFVFRTLFGAAAATMIGTAATTVTATPAAAQRRVTDNDPNDPEGRGRGYIAPRRRRVTDNDPHDPEGRGRGYARPVVRRRSITDSDPYDAAGRGRGYRRRY